MNFFKSVFADEPDPPNPESESESETGSSSNQDPQDPDPDPKPDPTPSSSSVVGGWNFGDLIKTIATKSETVIETYRRDLQEFGSGLKKEIEVAQGSLENVGSVIDVFGNAVIKGTAQIISQGTDAILATDHDSSDPSSDHNNHNQGYSSQQSLNSKKYSRFESQVRAIQSDVSTYCEEPEDLEEYEKWRSGFVLEEKREEIEGLLEENEAMESIYSRVAPNVVDDETFWCRYYFRVYKLKQAEDVRANLVKRAISVEEDEELSWDVDDEEYDESGGSGNAVAKSNLEGKWSEVVAEKEMKPDEEEEVGEKKGSMNVGENSVEVAKRESGSEDSEQKVVKEESSPVVLQSGASEIVDEKGAKSPKVDDSNDSKKESVVESSDDREPEKKVNVGEDSVKKDLPAKSDEKVVSEVKNEAPAASSKDNDASSAVASQSVSQQPEEEDLGWDEIEDLSTIDEKKEEKKLNKASGGGIAVRAELQKQLSTAEEDEDLSWDIDEDDEPTNA